MFVDGCFWHGCPSCYRAPRTNPKFWHAKVEANRQRDRRVDVELASSGWRVLRVWECRVASAKTLRLVRTALETSGKIVGRRHPELLETIVAKSKSSKGKKTRS